MNIKKAGEMARSATAIYAVIAVLVSGVVIANDWRNDTRYMQISEGSKIAIQVELRMLESKKKEYVIQESLEDDAKRKKVFEALIKNIQSDIDALRNNPS